MSGFGRTTVDGRRLAWAWALAAGLLWTGLAAAEPTRRLIEPGEAHLRRELRSLEGRLPTSPRGAGIQLERSRRDFTRPGGDGVRYLPEGARLERRFDRVERELDRGAREGATDASRPPEPGAVGRSGLPRSYGDPDDGLPRSYDDPGRGTAAGSGGGNLVTAARLLNRAETALERGRPQQARSDIALARTFLDGVAAAPPVAARRAALAERLGALERRAAEAADG